MREEGAGGGVWERGALWDRGDADWVTEEHHPPGREVILASHWSILRHYHYSLLIGQGHGDRQDTRRPHQLHQAQVPQGRVQTYHTPRQAPASHAAAR